MWVGWVKGKQFCVPIIINPFLLFISKWFQTNPQLLQTNWRYKCTVESRYLELGWVKFLLKSRTSLCINIYNLTPVESNSDESKFRLSRIKVLVLRCRKPYYLHSLSQIYLSKHVYYLGIKIRSQVKHPVIDFDILTLDYFTCLF